MFKLWFDNSVSIPPSLIVLADQPKDGSQWVLRDAIKAEIHNTTTDVLLSINGRERWVIVLALPSEVCAQR